MLFKFQKCLKRGKSFCTTKLTPTPIEDTGIMTYTLSQINEAIEHLEAIGWSNLSANWYAMFTKCHSLIKFTMPIKRDNDKNMTVEGYLAQHRCYNAPYNGRLRITPDVNERKLEAFAIHESIKSACHNIAFGGAKGAIKLDKTQISMEELKRVCEAYVRELSRKKIINSGIGILSTDLGSTKVEMGWIYDFYKKLNAHKDNNHMSAVLGKDITRGGIDGFVEATGLGISAGLKYFLTRNEFCNSFGVPIGIKGKRIIIQGYGEVGSWTHKYLQDIGFNVIGIIEKDSGVYCKEGLDYNKLIEHWVEKRSFMGMNEYKCMQGEKARELLFHDCDILILGATETIINQTNMEEVKAKMMVEGADAPISYIAQKYFESKHIPVVPDVLINSANLIASYVEWLKGHNYGWVDKFIDTMDKIEQKKSGNILKNRYSERAAVQIAIEDTMIKGCSTAFKYSLRHKVSMRVAAYAMAIERIVQNYDYAGLIY